MVVIKSATPIKGEVLMDGTKKASLINTRTYALEGVPAGDHEIVVRDGDRKFTKKVTVKPGQSITVKVKLPPAPRVQPKPKPRPQPKVSPKPKPRPQPKVSPKPRPRPKPRPQPKVRPKPKPKPRPRPGKKPGYLLVHSKPWSKIYVDGKATGRNTPVPPSNPLTLSPGKHKVTLETKGKKFNFTVTIKSGKQSKLIKILK